MFSLSLQKTEFTNISVTMIVFAVFSIFDGFLVFLLPETRGKTMPDSIEEIEYVFSKENDKNRSNSTIITNISSKENQ